MPLTCGVTLNLNNLKGDLEARAQAILNIDLGTPDGLQEIANKIEGELSAIADRVAAVVVIPPINISLRDELAALAALPLASLAAAAKIIQIAEDFGEAIGLQGFANLNLNDLSKSVFSLSTTFDPCNPTIPNILKGPDGSLQKLPSIQHILGATEAALKVESPMNDIIDNLGEALKNNKPIISDESAAILNTTLNRGVNVLEANAPVITENVKKETEATKKLIEENVSTAVTGMGDMVKKLPTGQPVVETKANFVERVKVNSLPLMDEEAEVASQPVPQSKVLYVADTGERVYEKTTSETPAQKLARETKLKEQRKATKARVLRLRKFRKDNPQLGRKAALIAFYKLPENK